MPSQTVLLPLCGAGIGLFAIRSWFFGHVRRAKPKLLRTLRDADQALDPYEAAERVGAYRAASKRALRQLERGGLVVNSGSAETPCYSPTAEGIKQSAIYRVGA